MRGKGLKLADMTPEQLTEIPGIGEKMVEKIQLSVAAYFQSLENPQQAETESVEALAEEEIAEAAVEQEAAAEETAEAADVAAEDIDAPTEAEEIAAAAEAHSQAGTAEPDGSTEISDEHGNK
jgi:N utilization substance protein A